MFESSKSKSTKSLKSAAILSMIESTNRYTTTNDSLIRDEQLYRNHVAEMTFTDEEMKKKEFNLFFIMLGTDPEKAFHYAML
jgi:hypothetical protein